MTQILPQKQIVPTYIVYGPVSTDEIKKGSEKIEGCGGCLVLALLIEKLNSLGYYTEYIGYDDELLQKKYSEYIQNGNIIVIYPESIVKNPLQAVKVVRWVLYFVSQEIVEKWEKDGNLIFFYWGHFYKKKNNKNFLNIMDIGFKRFKDYGKQRSGVCFRVAKGENYHHELTYHRIDNIQTVLKELNIEVKNPKKLNNYLTREQMCKIFNRYKLFFSYDCETAVSVILDNQVFGVRSAKGTQNFVSTQFFDVPKAGLSDIENTK